MSDDQTPPEGRLNMSDERADQLERRAILAELQDELLTWGKKRFWWVSILGIFGICAVINGAVYVFFDRVRYEAIQHNERAREAIQEMKDHTRTYEERLDQLKQRAQRVDSQFGALQGSLEFYQTEHGSRANRQDRGLETLEQRLDRLETLVPDLAARIQNAQGVMADYRRTVAQADTRNDVRTNSLRENEAYQVTLYYNARTRALARKALQVLDGTGFKLAVLDIQLALIRARAQAINDPVSSLMTDDDWQPRENTLVVDPADRDKAEEVRKFLAPIESLAIKTEAPGSLPGPGPRQIQVFLVGSSP